ncbi:hypothetical protein MNBD_GAMMA09-2245 [hydrothermal vent metagenome]|uniref:Cytochrome c family protein n=1 Tax=hydrothermal vent metagenome TaxID=652676 RepID=A0A3B0YHU5_9ZZZZ
MTIVIRALFLMFILPSVVFSADHPGHENTSNGGVDKLSTELRALLSQEMFALQRGMMSIIPAYISGKWDKIELTANKMKNSYILKQSLTESQKKELHLLLPQAFIEKDRKFHYLAGMLEHAAKMKKVELINFYFSEMNESCVGCHAVHATQKFPALAIKESSSHKN